VRREAGSPARARRRPAAVAVRHPGLVYSFHRGSDQPQPSDGRSSSQPEPRWKLSDTLIMIVAALRVLLPYVLVVLATVGAAWALWRLVFG
jgi:hypothetical protein